ncbi:MAG: DUF3291 domain-containing protein [Bryobacteraceae bacterium]|nr:DUF3291 domain-containing protein [Bryobacteraceae bacterium]
MSFSLAQVNIGRLTAPLEDPRIAGFVAELDSINKLAESSPGFLWRLKSDSGNATDKVWNDDPLCIVNMSVWESVESLKEFTYQTRHLEVFKQRRQWFEVPVLPHYCLWWVHAGHEPEISEARERLEYFQRHGATPFSFSFPQPFAAPMESAAASAT